MPTFRVTDPDQTVFRWDGLGEYAVTSDTARKIALTFSSAKAGRSFESDREAWKMVMTIKGGEVVKAGYFERDGTKIAEITGSQTEASLIRVMLDPDVDKGRDIYQLLLQGGATFEGNGKANGPNGYNDLTTTIGDDVVRTNGGNSYIKDVGGADLYVGGNDYDTISYNEWFWRNPARVERGIDADLESGRIKGADGEIDRLKGQFERVDGTFLDDKIRGNALDNEFQGMRGADLLDGRGGDDTVSYRNEVWQGGDRGVTVNLKKGFARDGFGDRDKLVSIERAEGTDYRDKFIDGGGNNQYFGRGGNDVFVIAGGNDGMAGGNDADRFVFKGTSFGDDRIWDFDPTEGDQLKIAAADRLGDLTITQNGADLEIELNGNASVTLENFTLGATDPASFLLF